MKGQNLFDTRMTFITTDAIRYTRFASRPSNFAHLLLRQTFSPGNLPVSLDMHQTAAAVLAHSDSAYLVVVSASCLIVSEMLIVVATSTDFRCWRMKTSSVSGFDCRLGPCLDVIYNSALMTACGYVRTS